jgi:hypothetical protein
MSCGQYISEQEIFNNVCISVFPKNCFLGPMGLQAFEISLEMHIPSWSLHFCNTAVLVTNGGLKIPH